MAIKIPRGAFAAGKAAVAAGEMGFNELELEPGKYNAILTACKTTKVNGQTKVVFDFRVPEVDKKAVKSIFYSLDEEYIKWLFNDLEKLGVDVEALDEEDLEPLLKKLGKARTVVRITAKEKDGYTNIRLDKVLEDMDADELEAEGGGKKKKSKPADDEDDEDEDEKPVKKKKKPVDEDEEEDEDEEDEKPVKKKKKKPVDDDDEDDE